MDLIRAKTEMPIAVMKATAQPTVQALRSNPSAPFSTRIGSSLRTQKTVITIRQTIIRTVRAESSPGRYSLTRRRQAAMNSTIEIIPSATKEWV